MILSAPSGAGKTSLAHALAERLRERGQRVAFSVSYTTRAPRHGEEDGRDYHFVDDATFSAMVQEQAFLEHAGVYERRYGTGRAATEAALQSHDLVILDIDWQGAQQVRKHWPQVLSVFIRPPSLQELERRLRTRGQDDEQTVAARMQQAEAELSHADEFDQQIVNDDFARALDALLALVDSRAAAAR